jgi:chemotaxis signal transduction protein
MSAERSCYWISNHGNAKGKWKMDKVTEEEDFKGLDEEIDDAVDRLFIDNKRGSGKGFSMESPVLKTPLKSLIEEPSIKSSPSEPSMGPPPLEPSMQSHISEPLTKPSIAEPSMKPSFLEPSYEFELEKNLDLQANLALEKNLDLETTPHPPSPPLEFSKSIDNMEAQLLSLEWEITEEKLKKTREEILALREVLKQKPDLASILSDMEKVLSHMIENEEEIRPSWIKILLDSKETIKLLTRNETEGEINIYKQLAYLGIESRFSSLEGLKESKVVQPFHGKVEGTEKADLSIPGEKKIEDMSNKMNLFMANVEDIFRTMKQQISRLEETSRKPAAPPLEVKPKPVNVTIFRVDKKLFAVQSEKVFKLFKVPNTFQKRYSNQEKIRFRDFELKMINLKKILAIPGGEPKGEIKILAAKDDGGYKGFMVDQVVKKISAPSEKVGEAGEYFSGVIHSTYQEQSVEIPILNLKKF